MLLSAEVRAIVARMYSGTRHGKGSVVYGVLADYCVMFVLDVGTHQLLRLAHLLGVGIVPMLLAYGRVRTRLVTLRGRRHRNIDCLTVFF